MLRPAILLILGSLILGCTQDFSVFELPGNTFESTSGPSSSASSGTSSAASGAGGASSVSTGTREDCTNGRDDDGDTAIDCADTDCNAGFTCVATAPTDWNGPVALYAGSPADRPTACPAAHPTQAYQGNSGLLSKAASCAPCACTTPTVTCEAAPLLFENNGCTAQVGMAVQPPPDTCQPIAPPGPTKAAKASAPTVSAGACVASGGDATLPPAAWEIAALACSGGLGTGCGAQASCVPRPAARFEPGLCVYRTGDQTCPDGFTVKHLFTDNVNDSRDCSDCLCGPAEAQCTATTSIFTGNACGGAPTNVVNNDICVPFTNGGSIQLNLTSSGSCPASGGQPTGTLTEGDLKTTVCCVP